MLRVSIHAPARGATRTIRRVKSQVCTCFNPRPRAGGDGVNRRPSSLYWRFNPRPRAGGDALHLHGSCAMIVSIHAPARGATRAARRWGLKSRFQSTPPRGGRRNALDCRSKWLRFNPRPRAGGDARCAIELRRRRVSIHAPARGATPRRHTQPFKRINVSIHAPARGATTQFVRMPIRLRCFNPRPRAGGDL